MNAVRKILPEALREKLGFVSAPESFAFSALAGGLPKGILMEISGPLGGGKTEIILRLLAENPQARVAWVERDFTIYPAVFPVKQVELDRVLFIEAGEDPHWIARQILRSQLFSFVILAGIESDETKLRRLQLEARKAQAAIILLNSFATRQGSWPIAIQIDVSRDLKTRLPVIEILKYKGRGSCVNA